MFIPIETCHHITKSRIFGVSIIIHILLLLWFLGFVRNNHLALNNPNPLLEQKETPKDDDMQWASTKARRGGAPILVFDTPTQKPSLSQNTQAQTPTEIPIVSSSEIKQEEILTQQPFLSTESTHKDPIPQVSEQSQSKTTATETSSIQQSNVFVQAARQALQKQHAHRQEMHHAPTPSAKQQSSAQSQPTSSSLAKNIPTMAQIAQGLSGFVKEEGEYTINVMGDPRKLPTEQQLKQHHYVEKILYCLHTSFATMKGKEPLVSSVLKDPSITFVIHRDGSVTDMHITQSSNNRLLDDFFIALFTDASQSFPPLPTYFERNAYRMNWLIMLQ